MASPDELGTGRYQLNVGGLVVRASASFIAAAVLKQTTSIGGDSARSKFSNTDFRHRARLHPARRLGHHGEIRQTWEHRSDLSWQRVEGTVNKQFDANWAGSLSYGRDSGDRKDGGAVSAAVKYFF